MSIHLIISEAEQFAIVNALAFYSNIHTCETAMDDESSEQWLMAFREDNGGNKPDGLIDKLITKVASLN